LEALVRTLIQNVRVFDGERVIPATDVLVDRDRIAAVGAEPGAADEVVDGTGRTLLPGLIDAHTHTGDGDLALTLRFGVTTELDMFSLPNNLARQRALAGTRDDVADLRSSGVLATPPGGHPGQLMSEEALAFYGDTAASFTPVASVGEAEAFVEARVAEGADYLKVVVDDGTHSGLSLPVLAPEVVKALTEAAHAKGLKAIAHVWTAEDARIALDAGVDGLAHVYTDLGEGPAAEALAARIARQGVFVVSTLVYIEAVTGGGGGRELVADPLVGPRIPEHLRGAGKGPERTAASERAAAAVGLLHRAGVPVLAGTDATSFGPVHGAAMLRELPLLVAAGLSPVEALRAATSLPAERFGLGDRGRVAPGLRADLLLVGGNPAEDVYALRSTVEVWRRGVRQTR
jgi:imidazolonepropionase-like amidohydrolase